MDIQASWEKALRTTEIIRPRLLPLHTHEMTKLPYVFLAESQINTGDTVVRKGEVWVEKPSIILPFNMPRFEGFEFEEGLDVSEELLKTFFLVRGIQFPSFKYHNRTDTVDVLEGKLSKAIETYRATLERRENVHAGLIAGSEDCWPFSVLIFVASQAHRSAEGDIRKLLDDYRKN